MSVVEMQTSVLPPTFPVSDTRLSQSAAYLDHKHDQSQYVNSRQSSKENKTPPAQEKRWFEQATSPQSIRGLDAVVNGAVHKTQLSPDSGLAGKKRTANGQVKELSLVPPELPKKKDHSRNASATSTTSNATVTELSQQLRTRLTYAMIKVQNGWQDRSLEEVESLASASPRSTTFNHYSDNRPLLSPRAAITAQLSRQKSDSSDSNHSQSRQIGPSPMLMGPALAKGGLAPPANIVTRPSPQRRRPAPNMQVSTGMKPPLTRPAVAQRTPSQNAAMEADAVETLLFMASPNNSGSAHQSSQFSPVTSAPSVHHFSAQTSPLRNTFSAPVSPKRVAFAPVLPSEYAARYCTDKDSIIESLIEKLDEDGDADLDEALKLMERHHATKITT